MGSEKYKDVTIRLELGLGTAEPELFRGEGMSNSEKCKNYYIKKNRWRNQTAKN